MMRFACLIGVGLLLKVFAINGRLSTRNSSAMRERGMSGVTNPNAANFLRSNANTGCDRAAERDTAVVLEFVVSAVSSTNLALRLGSECGEPSFEPCVARDTPTGISTPALRNSSSLFAARSIRLIANAYPARADRSASARKPAR